MVGNGIRFGETKYSNDVMFSVLTGCRAKRIAARDISFYVVTEREGSLTSAFCQKEGELAIRTSVFFNAQRIVRSYGFPMDDRLAFRLMQRLFVEDRHQFKVYFKTLTELSGNSRIKLIDKIFEPNRFASRLKRTLYSYIVTFDTV